ncbi:MAG TPA: excinuclease ABC subunit UvrA [Candidatus Pullilachnospira gallistercoris]|uniref:UvrABC system protein A n=1 Tax=Candidatus Pullilachnospira gallistercoris TaxID=2840911 RepID=A0A9D1EBI7_9FIRM|nr:excinuclease ABC subunit UvrA [Candidatus Pullilachnospira gallistercoris]
MEQYKKIRVRGAKVHNLKNIDVDIPLNEIVGIAGVSGSGKSSLALGVLYAEGSRRYLEALSTYTRRRMTQAAKAQVDEVLYVPAALALHQRPGIPGIRSTFGTGTELLNSLRLMYSRLASHRCPNGHYVQPSLAVAAMQEITCPVCGAKFYGPSAEELAFNSQGACRTCDGTGTVRKVDISTLVPDESLTIDEGAVAPWNSLMWSLMTDVCREMGVRTDVPFRDLTDREKEIVYHGPAEKKHILYHAKKTNQAGELDFTYYNAVYTVENALAKVKDEKGMKRVEKFLKQEVCPDCGGSRLSEAARAPKLRGISLDEACRMTLTQLTAWVEGVPASLPEEMRPMAESICESFRTVAKRLLDLGLGYLALDRAASTLSTGERQRMQLARAVRNRTTGVLYVLDEPSIGLHPSNIEGLTGVMEDLIADGNSVVLVDHDIQILKKADWIVEMGPGAGADGGRVIAEGTPVDLGKNAESKIGPFFSGEEEVRTREQAAGSALFDQGKIHLSTGAIHTVKPLEVNIPKGRLTVVTGVSGSGKTTLILESLIPGLKASIDGKKLPDHVKEIKAEGISQVKLIDAAPIGINVRSTVATYANVHDELRKIFARTPDAKALGYKAGDFSYNTGKLRCPVCDGTGSISLDVQFLPDVQITCPQCRGARYAKEAEAVRLDVAGTGKGKVIQQDVAGTKAKKKESAEGSAGGKKANPAGNSETYSLPQLMSMDVNHALEVCKNLRLVRQRLQVLQDLGLGYLTLGEETPSLSGGEAQRLKLASEMGKTQSDSVFVFDEPTIGLHPLDVRTLLGVFQTLIENGATVIVIEHDLDVIRNADYIIDMGPGGGQEGGKIVATGTPEEIKKAPESRTGQFL